MGNEYKPDNFLKGMCLSVIVVITVFSAIVFYAGYLKIKNFNMENSVDITIFELNENESSVGKSGSAVFSVSKDRPVFLFYILLFIYALVACIILSIFSYILVKDDGGIRFAKLNALMKVKPDFEKDKNWVIEEQQFLCCSKQKEDNTECPCKKNKSIETNENNLPGITTKYKNIYLELTKTLMHSITEI